MMLSAQAALLPLALASPSDWLDGTQTLTVDRAMRIAAFAERDLEVKALFERAFVRAKVKSVREFFETGHLQVCPAKQAGAGFVHHGHTNIFGVRYTLYPSLDSILKNESVETRYQALAEQSIEEAQGSDGKLKPFESHAFVSMITHDYDSAGRLKSPVICIYAGLSEHAAYETLVHELSHFTDLDKFEVPDPLSVKNEEEYLLKLIQLPGQEVDAFIAGNRALIRLEKSRAHVNAPLRNFFNNSGDLVVSREAFARGILAPAPQGLSYAEGSLQSAYADAVWTEWLFKNKLRDDFTAKIEECTENYKIFRSNAETVHLPNIKMYELQVSRDQSALDREKADYEQAIQSANAMVRCRRQLAAELKDIDAYLAALLAGPAQAAGLRIEKK